MELELFYDSQEQIPAGFASLYTERDGKWHLTGVRGMKTQVDIDNVTRALTNERTNHNKTKQDLQAYTALGTVTDLQAQLDRIPTLEAASAGKDTKAIEEAAQRIADTKIAPLQRQIAELQTANQTLTQTNEGLQTTIKTGKIKDEVRKLLIGEKVVDTAHEDVLMYAERLFDVNEDGSVSARDNSGLNPGTSPADWLRDQKKARPHWWPPSVGGGAAGGGGQGAGGDNPWSKQGWNLTKQGQIVREQGEEAAGRMAAAAGSRLGAVSPPA